MRSGQIDILTECRNILQSRTALADTAGSAFSQECRELLEQGNFDVVLDRLIEQFPLLFAKASPGELQRIPRLSQSKTLA